jgi:hypothetical protein
MKSIIFMSFYANMINKLIYHWRCERLYLRGLYTYVHRTCLDVLPMER